jgi:hypothetical protein
MSYRAVIYKVMIASPNDVVIERNIVRDVINEWNVINAEKRGMVLLPVGWDTHASPSMEGHPQSIINKQVLKDSDLLIGIFWTRLGTPTDKYPSGTVEEIEEHLKLKKPAMLYFSLTPVRPDSVDAKEYDRLVEFRKSCQERGIYDTYSDYSEFKEKFYRELQIELNKDTYISIPGEQPVILESENSPLPRLSKEAQKLLIAASKDQNGMIMRLQHLSGTSISSNNISFSEESNPRSVALWEGAIRDLENFGFIEAASYKREIFNMTREGYKAAELLGE